MTGVGHDPGDPAGLYGEGTQAAVRAFQIERRIRADGICGPQTWSALVEVNGQDGDGNSLSGDVKALRTSNSYIRTDGPLVATLGVEDLIVVRSGNATLVAPRARAQEVRRLVERLADEAADFV